MRGSRRSFATRPCRDAPDASRSRQAPVRTSGGAFNPTRRSGLWRILNSVGWTGSLTGALALWATCIFQPTPGGAPAHTPDHSRTEPKRPFGQRSARGLSRCLPDPPHCAGKRADRPEGKSLRKTPDPHPGRLPHEGTRTGGDRRRTIGAPCGRQSPADYTKQLRRSSLSRSSLGCTEVQPREPRNRIARRFRVPSLI